MYQTCRFFPLLCFLNRMEYRKMIFVFHAFFCVYSVFASVNTDQEALIAIKRLVKDDPFHALSSWNESLNVCNWRGVECGHRHQRVTLLNISSLRLVGSLSPYIGNLSFLREINIQENNFHGPIPQEIGRLFRLKHLILANNSFRGELPINLTRCTDLRVLDLGENNLEGNIPGELSSLSKLYQLSLSRNNFSGKIPRSLGNLTSLRMLDVSRNDLDGHIPLELGKLSNLYSFELSSNRLSGSVPAQLYNVSSIQIFSITNNRLIGSFPADLGFTLPKLSLFLAGTNQFSGSIPPSLANASRLVRISIGYNALTGPIPLNLGVLQDLQVLHIGGNPFGADKANNITSFISSLTNCSNLQVLSLFGMQIRGVLPTSIGNLSKTLGSVWLDENYISGSIPVEIGNLVGLSYLTIDTNMLTGIIPDSIGKLTGLQQFYLFENKIRGKVPSSIGNITGLRILILEDNMLEGNIPESLGNCSGLEGIHLARNRLTGTVPESIFSLSSLSIGLNLAGNLLSGPLSSQVGNLKNLVLMRLSNNKFSGEIPSSLGDCVMMGSLYMEGNFFEGNIPSSLGQLRSIDELDLSRNNLSGQIPRSYGELRLISYLNLSFNMLEGEVPDTGVFTNISAFSIMGNRNLCGGIQPLNLPACPKEATHKRIKISHLRVTVLAISICLSFALLSLIVYAVWRSRKSKPRPCESLKEENPIPRITYGDLLQSTNEFALENLIGEGRYGSVYKGTILNPGEQIVAVKVLNLQQHGANKSFLAECEALRNVRHRNLVKIITSCSSTDFKGNDFKALVFEFMPNGNLESWLHPISTGQQDPKNLNLVQRLNIAIDVASALDYLHRQCETPIIHCDLKPSNILLDSDLNAHVGDFGLAKFLFANIDTSNQANSSTVGVRGTVGYIAPEYGMGEEVSAQGDIYSYGILLLEMFTGKRPTGSMFSDNVSLHNYAKAALPDQLTTIIDQQLLPAAKDDALITAGGVVRTVECLKIVIQVAVTCSDESPSERMDINDVLAGLRTARKVL